MRFLARSQVSRLAILGGGGIPLVLIGLVSLAILHQRDVALDVAEQANQAFGVALAEQAERTMQAADLVLQEAVAKGDPASVDSAGAFSAAFGSAEMHDFLVDRLRNLPQADALSVVDATGKLVNFSRAWPVPDIDLADRDHFQYFSTHDDHTPFISQPTRSRADESWTIYLVRRINGASGTFRGLILCAIKLSYFNDLYRAITPSDGGSTSLLRRDGTILIRYPNGNEQVGAKFEPSSPWYGLVANGGGNFRSPGYARGQPRLVSAHPLRGYPLVVNVALSQDAALAHWRHESLVLGLGTAAASLALIAFLSVLNWQFRRLERSRGLLQTQAAALAENADALRASERQLAEKSAALELTLDHMDQGLMMIAADGTVMVSNRRTREIFDLPAEVMDGKPNVKDLAVSLGIQDRRRHLPDGEFGGEPAVYDRVRPDGRVIEVRTVPLAGGGAVRTYTDITARKAAEERMRYFAHHDDLTRLPNRVVFLERLTEAVTRFDTGAFEPSPHPASPFGGNRSLARSFGEASRDGGRGIAVLFMDLDRFKLVNDTRGHQVGDRLLAEVADRIRANLRDTDIAARMGGDEFAIIQSRVDQPASAHALARRLLEAIGAPYEIQGQLSVIGISIGVAVFPADGATADQLLRNADTALYRAKEDGRNTIRFFEPAMDIRHQERSLLEQDLRTAVQRRQFSLAYQPIIETTGQDIVAFEALLRWHHPQRGPIAPDEFIPLAESSGLIVPLGLWAMETACAEAAAWSRPVRIAVNLSPMQFRQADLPDKVAEILLRTGLPGHRLELEVTEGLLQDDAGLVLTTMRALRRLGIRIALDDFGTGHASLSYLRRLPFDHIKIDRSFVQNMTSDHEARAIVESIVTLGTRLRLTVVAEGVETEAQFALLRDLGCEQVQGYFTGRPMSPDQARALLNAKLSGTEVG
jgi:diguanylate cyclase (GGDEF)-like protein